MNYMYVTHNFKNYKTVDCISFEVNSSSRKIRCDKCYKKERKRIEREKKQKQRVN